jgi:hypothetical protein
MNGEILFRSSGRESIDQINDLLQSSIPTNIGYPPDSGGCGMVPIGATSTQSYDDFACGVASVIAWNNVNGSGGWAESAYNFHEAHQDSVAYLIEVSLQHWEETIHKIDDLGNLLDWLSYFPELAKIPFVLDPSNSKLASYSAAMPQTQTQTQCTPT